MDEVESVVTRRLRLEPLAAGTIEALLAGDLRAASRLQDSALSEEFVASLGGDFLRMQLEQLVVAPAYGGWCARSMVRRHDGTVVGHCGFHGPPALMGRAEVGYTVLAPFRGRGYATEAVAALVAWARGQGQCAVIASVSPRNTASVGVVERLGFRRRCDRPVGTSGDEVEFELDLEDGPVPPPIPPP